MPIERQVVSHRFGIFTEARRNELVHSAALSENLVHEDRADKSPRKTQDVVDLINSTTNELELLSLEDEACSLVRKIKYKLSNTGKNKSEDLQTSWKDLRQFVNCRSNKLQIDALELFRKSLSDSPLSKSLVSNLLHLGKNVLEELLKSEKKCVLEKKTFHLSDVLYLVFSRLYYHHLVQDLNEIQREQMQEIRLLRKALSEKIHLYEDDPILCNQLSIAAAMIDAVCNEKLSAPTAGDDSLCSEPLRKEPLAKFLWNCLKLWKRASKQLDLDADLVEKSSATDFSTLNPQHPQWLDFVLAFYTLCECSKLDINYLKLLMRLRTKMLPKSSERLKNGPNVEIERSKWNVSLVVTYLRCLADVSKYGVSIAIQRLSLLGNDRLYGLVDYLTHLPSDEGEETEGDGTVISSCAFHLISGVYSFFQCDPMKDGLKNIAWSSLMKFNNASDKSISNQVSVRNRESDVDDRRTSIFSIFSKICTNLCVVAFSSAAHISPTESRDVVKDSKRRPKTSKCYDKTLELVDKPKKVETERFINPSREQMNWSEMQQIANEHLQKELKQDEIEKELMRKEMEKSASETSGGSAADQLDRQ